MTHHISPCSRALDRRTFLVASGAGVAGMQFGSPSLATATKSTESRAGKAKSTILFFLCGGASHLDTWD
ncbi:MAG TPA: twin-arginine translocation signal domain-containing protein, partial [Pirellulaceae bacterium]|nr:twin-arginine translocation signal domain-containing protein [Pirellulaceae bacterium]